MAPTTDDVAPQGLGAAGFESVREAFIDVVRGQDGTGAATAIWHDGRWVADLWGGWTDSARTLPWQRDSIVMPYSVTKAFTAMAALVLVDRELLDLDDAVQRHWPQASYARDRPRAALAPGRARRPGRARSPGAASRLGRTAWAASHRRLIRSVIAEAVQSADQSASTAALTTLDAD